MAKGKREPGAILSPARYLPAAVIVLVCATAYASWVMVDLNADRQSADYAASLLIELGRLETDLTAAESAQRGYLLTGDQLYLDAYDDFEATRDERLAKLARRAGARSPAQAERIERVRTKLEAKFAEMRKTIRAYQSGDRTEAVAIVRGDRGLAIMNEIRAIFDELFASEARILAGHTRELRGSRRLVQVLILGLGALGLLLVVAAAIFNRRRHLELARHQLELTAVNAGLEKKVEERTAALKEANAALEVSAEELARSNRELNDFAFIASHDLQEPLRKIRAFGDQLESDFSDALGDEGRDFLGRMQGAAGRMSQLISDLLEYSRVDRRGRPFEEVPLDEVLDMVVEDLEVRIAETSASVKREPLPTTSADPTQMRQLLQNLLSNAIKFRRPEVSPEVSISSERTDTGWRLSVADNGIGFEAKYAEQIFAPFQRLHTRSQYEGTGIGLAICRRIVERHGGTLAVASEPGAGTTFTIDLPDRE